MYLDRITCRECRCIFDFTKGEQEFYAEKGFQQPQRCRDCRGSRPEKAPPPERTLYSAPCAECGEMARVPFEPKSDRPIYCHDCFVARRTLATSARADLA